MSVQYIGLSEINGPIVVLENVPDLAFEEMVQLKLENGTTRTGRVVQVQGTTAAIQVFEGTNDLGLQNTVTKFTGQPMKIPLSKEILGRVLNGSGKPIDGLGEIYPDKFVDVNGSPLNPVRRVYPRNYINTGISSIDCLMTLIRGQKLPIFSGSGMQHNKLAVQIVKQAKISEEEGGSFCVVFGAMGAKNDVAEYFRSSFEQSGEADLPPTAVSGISTATAISASELHTCALLKDNSVWCWGRNVEGQLGGGTSALFSTVPVKVVDVG